MIKMKPWKWALTLPAACLLMVSLLAGCASKQEARGNNGTLKLSLEVSQIFETYQVLPEYRYYYTGSVTKPNAIMGIDRNYTLDTRLWNEVVNLTPEQLKKRVDLMNGFRPPTRTFGAYILDGSGEQVGIWYSPYNDAPVAVQPDKRIQVIPHTNFRKAGK